MGNQRTRAKSGRIAMEDYKYSLLEEGDLDEASASVDASDEPKKEEVAEGEGVEEVAV